MIRTRIFMILAAILTGSNFTAAQTFFVPALDTGFVANGARTYPNPFNPSTTLRFSLPRSANVTLTVYNVLGQKVAVLVENEILTAGEHLMNFEAGHLSTGVYLYRLEANNFTSYHKMMLIR